MSFDIELDAFFPNSQFLIPGFHEPMRLDITSKRSGMLIYIKSSLPSKITSNFKLSETIQAIPFELNLRKEKGLLVSVYKPPLQSNSYFLDTLNDLLDFHSGMYDNKVVFGDFSLEPTNPVMINFMDSQNFTNLIENNTCFKGVGSCIDLILTNRKYCFKNTSSYETGVSDHHHLIFSIMKTIFASEEPKKFVYRDYKTFSHENFKNDLSSKTVDENVDYSKLGKEFTDTLNKHAPTKTNVFRGNQKSHVNKVLRSVIMKRSRLKIKANKTRKAADIFDYKKHRNSVVKINNECEREYFDKLNVKTTTKPFWKTCKPYFSNKHSHGGSKITLIENDRIICKNNKIAKTFNTYFESVTDSLNLFEWIGESVNSNDKIEQILFKFSKHPSILKIKQKVKINRKFSFQSVLRIL